MDNEMDGSHVVKICVAAMITTIIVVLVISVNTTIRFKNCLEYQKANPANMNCLLLVSQR